MSYDEQLRTNSLLQMINETLRYTILRSYVEKLQYYPHSLFCLFCLASKVIPVFKKRIGRDNVLFFIFFRFIMSILNRLHGHIVSTNPHI